MKRVAMLMLAISLILNGSMISMAAMSFDNGSNPPDNMTHVMFSELFGVGPNTLLVLSPVFDIGRAESGTSFAEEETGATGGHTAIKLANKLMNGFISWGLARDYQDGYTAVGYGKRLADLAVRSMLVDIKSGDKDSLGLVWTFINERPDSDRALSNLVDNCWSSLVQKNWGPELEGFKVGDRAAELEEVLTNSSVKLPRIMESGSRGLTLDGKNYVPKSSNSTDELNMSVGQVKQKIKDRLVSLINESLIGLIKKANEDGNSSPSFDNWDKVGGAETGIKGTDISQLYRARYLLADGSSEIAINRVSTEMLSYWSTDVIASEKAKATQLASKYVIRTFTPFNYMFVPGAGEDRFNLFSGKTEEAREFFLAMKMAALSGLVWDGPVGNYTGGTANPTTDLGVLEQYDLITYIKKNGQADKGAELVAGCAECREILGLKKETATASEVLKTGKMDKLIDHFIERHFYGKSSSAKVDEIARAICWFDKDTRGAGEGTGMLVLKMLGCQQVFFNRFAELSESVGLKDKENTDAVLQAYGWISKTGSYNIQGYMDSIAMLVSLNKYGKSGMITWTGTGWNGAAGVENDSILRAHKEFYDRIENGVAKLCQDAGVPFNGLVEFDYDSVSAKIDGTKKKSAFSVGLKQLLLPEVSYNNSKSSDGLNGFFANNDNLMQTEAADGSGKLTTKANLYSLFGSIGARIWTSKNAGTNCEVCLELSKAKTKDYAYGAGGESWGWKSAFPYPKLEEFIKVHLAGHQAEETTWQSIAGNRERDWLVGLFARFAVGHGREAGDSVLSGASPEELFSILSKVIDFDKGTGNNGLIDTQQRKETALKLMKELGDALVVDSYKSNKNTSSFRELLGNAGLRESANVKRFYGDNGCFNRTATKVSLTEINDAMSVVVSAMSEYLDKSDKSEEGWVSAVSSILEEVRESAAEKGLSKVAESAGRLEQEFLYVPWSSEYSTVSRSNSNVRFADELVTTPKGVGVKAQLVKELVSLISNTEASKVNALCPDRQRVPDIYGMSKGINDKSDHYVVNACLYGLVKYYLGEIVADGAEMEDPIDKEVDDSGKYTGNEGDKLISNSDRKYRPEFTVDLEAPKMIETPQGVSNVEVQKAIEQLKEVNFWGNMLGSIMYSVGVFILGMNLIYVSLYILIRTSSFIPAKLLLILSFGKLNAREMPIKDFFTRAGILLLIGVLFTMGLAYESVTQFIARVLILVGIY